MASLLRSVLSLVFLLISVTVHCILCERFYIVPSVDQGCPVNSNSPELCLTLQQFASNVHNYSTTNESDVTLELLPGMHPLTTGLFMSNRTSFRMKGEDGTVVFCNYTPPVNKRSFTYNNVHYVQIHKIVFKNCGETLFQTINLLSVQYSRILNGKSWILSRVANGTVKSTDLLNGQSLVVESSLLAIISSTLNNLTGCTGGAIRCYYSVLTVESTDFYHNRANCTLYDNGGAIFAESTLLTMTYVDFRDNTAHAGGAVHLKRGSIDIYNSIFYDNSALIGNGGALHVSHSNISLRFCWFYRNSAQIGGSALY